MTVFKKVSMISCLFNRMIASHMEKIQIATIHYDLEGMQDEHTRFYNCLILQPDMYLYGGNNGEARYDCITVHITSRLAKFVILKITKGSCFHVPNEVVWQF